MHGQVARGARTGPPIGAARHFLVPDRDGLPATLAIRDGADWQRAAGRRLHRGEPRLQASLPALSHRSRLRRPLPHRPDPASCWRTSGGRSAAGRGTSRSAIPTFSTAPRTRASWCARFAREFPGLTYDVTIKIEHLLEHADLLPLLRDTGCLFVTSAVESIDDRCWRSSRRGTRAATSNEWSHLCRRRGADARRRRSWRSRRGRRSAGYCELLHAHRSPRPGRARAPMQLMIRLLIPEGSRLLELDDIRALVGRYSPASLTYPWRTRSGRRRAAAPGRAMVGRRLVAIASVNCSRRSGTSAHAAAQRVAVRRARRPPRLPARGDPLPERALVLLSGADAGAGGSDLDASRALR